MGFALLLGYEVKKLIIGESISKRKEKNIKEAVLTFREVKEIISIKTMHLSHDTVIIGMELRFNQSMQVAQLEKVIDRIELKIKKIIPKAKCYIEAENEESD